MPSVVHLATAVVLLAQLIAVLWNPSRIGHDQAQYLQVGDLLRTGAVPYVDVIDTNPPLIQYVNVIPAAIAHLIGTQVILTFLLIVWGLTVASTLATYGNLRRVFARAPLQADLATLSVALFPAFFIYSNSYGQREHLFVLAILPFITLRLCRYSGVSIGTTGAVATGVLAAAAACFKPHFVVAALAAELYMASVAGNRRTLRSSEFIAFLVTGLAYAVHFFILPVPMRTAWFDRVLPIVSAGYSAYGMPLKLFVVKRVRWWLPAIATALVGIFMVRAEPERTFMRTMAIFTFAGVAGLMVQHKGWAYHAIPAQAGMTVMLAVIVGTIVERADVRAAAMRVENLVGRIASAALAAALIAEALAVLTLAVWPRSALRLEEATETNEVARAVVAWSRPGDAVLVIATTVGVAYPVLTQFDRHPGTRFTHSFPLPMLYRDVVAVPGQPYPYELADPRRRAEEQRFRAEMSEDIRTRRPALILVGTPRVCQACPAGFNLDDYLAHTHFIDTAMSGYQLVERLGVATVYRRRS